MKFSAVILLSVTSLALANPSQQSGQAVVGGNTPPPSPNTPTTGSGVIGLTQPSTTSPGGRDGVAPGRSIQPRLIGGDYGGISVSDTMSKPVQQLMFSPNVIQQCALDSEELWKAIAAHRRKIAKGYRDLAKGAREHGKTLSDPDSKESREKDARDYDKTADGYDDDARADDQRAKEAEERARKAAQEERDKKAEAERQEKARAERARKAAEEKARAEQAERDARRAKFEKELKDKADKAAADRLEARRAAQRQALKELVEAEERARSEQAARKSAFEASGRLAERTGGRKPKPRGKDDDREVSGTGETFAKEGFEIGTKGATQIATGAAEGRIGKAAGNAIGAVVDGAFTVKDVVEFGKAAQEVVDKGASQRQQVTDRIDQLSDPNYKMKRTDASSGGVYGKEFKDNAAKLVSAAPLPKF